MNYLNEQKTERIARGPLDITVLRSGQRLGEGTHAAKEGSIYLFRIGGK